MTNSRWLILTLFCFLQITNITAQTPVEDFGDHSLSKTTSVVIQALQNYYQNSVA